MVELARQGWSIKDIYRRAHEEGWTTRKRNPWSREWIRYVVRREPISPGYVN